MAPDKPTGTGLALAGSVVHRVMGAELRVPMPFEELAGAVALAEDTGYRSVWVPDHGVWDPFSLLAAFAQRTSRIGLAPGVATVTSREPAAMAAAVRTLAEVSGGRAILGVGSGPERRIERVRSYVQDVRDRVEDREVPVYLAALGPRMVGAAVGAADGVLLNWCPPERVRRAREELATTPWPFANTPRPEVRVVVYVRACLGHDDDHALAALREAVAMYARIPSYRRQFEAEGLGTDPDQLVRALCVWGDRDRALARLEAWRQAGADQVVVYPVTAQEPASSLVGTIMAAAPNPAVEH
jgi:probable F420-dependent oxidoreductase